MSMHLDTQMIKQLRFLLITTLLVLFVNSATAQAPQLINFQAQVENLPATTTPVTFSIFDTPSGGTALWSETQSITSGTGIIQVLLGSESPFPGDLFSNNGERFLELNINGEILSPRFQLTSVSYALRSAFADDIAGGNVTSVNTLNGDVMLKEGANVTITQDGQEITIASAGGGGGGGGVATVSGGGGIEVTNPNGPVAVVNVEENGLNDSHIQDDALTSNSLAPASVGASELANGTAVRSVNGLTEGVTLAGGTNVTLNTEGQTITINAAGAGGGGGGISNLVAGNGIAIDDPDGPTSTIEIAENGVGSDELESEIQLGPNGELAIGNASNDLVASIASGAGGGGIRLVQTSGGFDAANLSIRTFGGSSNGGQLQLRGNPDWDAIHLFADSDTQGGRMVFREPVPGSPQDAFSTLTIRGNDGKGHIIIHDNGSNYISIGGDNREIKTRGRVGIGLTQGEYDSDTELDVELFVRGDAVITGDVSNSASTSSMDHPMDPQNMVLSHSGVISSERMTVYSGNVTLNNQGEATVQLPEWFESLNTDFRYQLTPIGDWARLYIAEKVNNNQFTIAGGRNGLEVSWQITALRNDPYAQSNPVEVEQMKAPDAQGTYINPEAYGVSKDQ